MANFDKYIIGFIIGILILTGTFFAGMAYKKCPAVVIIPKDTAIKVPVAPVVSPDPLPAKRATIYRDIADTSYSNFLLHQIDSLNDLLKYRHIAIAARIDTTVGAKKDTLRMFYDETNHLISYLYLGFTPRDAIVKEPIVYNAPQIIKENNIWNISLSAGGGLGADKTGRVGGQYGIYITLGKTIFQW